MKSVYVSLAGGLFCLLAVACGSDKAAENSPGTPDKVACTPITDEALVKAGFSTATPMACSPTMYAKYGDAGFAAVNGKIAGLALAAPTDKLGDTFQTKIANANDTRKAEFGAHLLSFLENAYGNPNAYVGPGMVESHAHLGITVAQYNYFVTDVVVPALKAVGVSDDDISKCFAPTVTYKDFVKTVVTCE